MKNIGRGLITRMMREREVNGPFADFQDFCYRMDGNDMNKRAVENLIRAGAFDSMGVHRSQLIAVYEKGHGRHLERQPRECRGQLDFFGMGGGAAQREPLHLPDIPEFSAQERMAMKETTGLYLRSPDRRLPGAVPPARRRADRPHSGDFAQEAGPTIFADGQKLSIAGVVTSSKVKTTRSNTLMAYVTVEGQHGRDGNALLRPHAGDERQLPQEGRPSCFRPPERARREGPAAHVRFGATARRQRSRCVRRSGGEKRQTLYLRLPSMDSHEMTQFRRIAYLFEGKAGAYPAHRQRQAHRHDRGAAPWLLSARCASCSAMRM